MERPLRSSYRQPLISSGCLGVVALLVSACATITQGSAQTVRLTTDPPGASCTLSRNGEVLTTVRATPATLSVFKQKGRLQLVCRKPGYFDHSMEEGSDFEDMTLGNIIFGGLVGVFVDAGSGAMYEYPSAIHVTLIPESFPDESTRDRFFDGLRERVNAETESAKTELLETCGETDCEGRLARLEAARQARLDEIERKRSAAAGTAEGDR